MLFIRKENRFDFVSLQKDRYILPRDIDSMRNYVERNIENAKKIVVPEPEPIVRHQESVDDPSKVSKKFFCFLEKQEENFVKF